MDAWEGAADGLSVGVGVGVGDADVRIEGVEACITCSPVPTASASNPSRADLAISLSAVVVDDSIGGIVAGWLVPAARFWWGLLTAVPGSSH